MSNMDKATDFPVDEPFLVDAWRVDPAGGCLTRGEQTVKLEPKVMTVLQCLARVPGKVVSREELESVAWAGTVVGYDALASSIIKLRKAFDDDSRNPHVIETVPKKGYRLIAEVRPASPASTVSPTDSVQGPAQRSTLPLANPAARRSLLGLVAVGVLALGLVLGWYFQQSETEPSSAHGRLSIAVLPFKNLSDDPQQDYFSDGMTADLITDLSKLSGLSVIARNSVFAYKDAPEDLRAIGRELGVRYLVDGSVRKAEQQVRITASLIEVESGVHLWAERFDGTLRDVFALQDRVTEQIVASLQVRLTERERIQLAHAYTDNIEAYDHFLHGWQRFWEFSKDGNADGRDYFLKAVETDPNFARAYANLAITHVYDFLYGWSEHSEQSLQLANEYAAQAIALDPSLPQVHWAMGLTEIFNRQYQRAIQQAEKAIQLDPNFADAYGLLATTLNYAANPQKAREVMLKAMRLNPRHPFIYKVICGEIYFNLRDYATAIDYFSQALDRNPEAQEPRMWRAAAYAHVGRIDDAEWELEHIRNAGADLSLERIEQVIPFKDPTQREHLIDGLYKAGLGS